MQRIYVIWLWCDIFVANCLVRGFGHGHSDMSDLTIPNIGLNNKALLLLRLVRIWILIHCFQ